MAKKQLPIICQHIHFSSLIKNIMFIFRTSKQFSAAFGDKGKQVVSKVNWEECITTPHVGECTLLLLC